MIDKSQIDQFSSTTNSIPTGYPEMVIWPGMLAELRHEMLYLPMHIPGIFKTGF